MVVRCVVCDYRWSATSKDEGITFHSLPKDELRRKSWEDACHMDMSNCKPSEKICSSHFKPGFFDRTGQTVRLRSYAVPRYFYKTIPAAMQDHSCIWMKSDIDAPVENSIPAALQDHSCIWMNSDIGAPVENSIPKSNPPSALQDHTYDWPKKTALIKKWTSAQKRIDQLQRELDNCRIRERRAKRHVQCTLTYLQGKDLLNDELESKLSVYCDIPMDIFRKPIRKNLYSKQQWEVAFKIRKYGWKAYDYFRRTIKLPLPSPRTLRRRLKKKKDSTYATIRALLQKPAVSSQG